MGTLLLTDGRELPVPEALERELDAASIDRAAQVAQVVDADLSPALLLITDGDVAYVTRHGAQRWTACELERIEANDVVPVAGPAVTIGSWGAVAERAEFLRAAAALLRARPAGAADVQPAAPGAQPERAPAAHRWRSGALGLMCGALGAIIGGLGLASTTGYVFNDPGHGRALIAFVAATGILGVPALVAGVALARRDSPWRDLGVFGAAIAGLALFALAPALVALTLRAPHWHL